MRTYTEVGKKEGYEPEEIDKAIEQVEWEAFRTSELPFMQGECIKQVVKECNIPLTKISRMALHNVIKETHGFYSLNVKYKNGQAQIYIADDGCGARVVATDFNPNQ